MAKNDKVLVHHDFVCATEAELSEQLKAFRAAHEAEQGQILAMDARRSLGPGKVRVTFRVVDKPGKKR